KVDGLTFLRMLRGDPKTASVPVVLLTSSADKDRVLEAARLGVKNYVLKSQFSLKALLTRVKECVSAAAPGMNPSVGFSVAAESANAPSIAAPSAAPRRAGNGSPDETLARLLTRDDCISRAEHVFEAKTLSGVVMQVISMAASPRTDVSQLAELISRDALLSARVLQAANSAAYASGSCTTTTIADAVRRVGCSTVRNIAAALGIFDVI